jgi:hypothetical protein
MICRFKLLPQGQMAAGGAIAWQMVSVLGIHDKVKLNFSSGLNKYPGEFESEEYSTYYDKGHGRIERRTIRLVGVLASDKTIRDWLPAATAWEGLATVIE